MLEQRCQEFIALIQKEEFFKAHEVLEELWFPKRKEKSEELLILKGFINAAVALELKKRGKKQQAQQVWKTYQKYSLLISPSSKPIFKEISALLNSLF